jgi:transcriptional regulator with XRE-family HTH domain
MTNRLACNTHRSSQLELARCIGNVLRTKRKAKNISQEAFADFIKMHRTYYGALERGEKNLSIVTLQRMASAHGIRVAMLVDEAEQGRFQP